MDRTGACTSPRTVFPVNPRKVPGAPMHQSLAASMPAFTAIIWRAMVAPPQERETGPHAQAGTARDIQPR